MRRVPWMTRSWPQKYNKALQNFRLWSKDLSSSIISHEHLFSLPCACIQLFQHSISVVNALLPPFLLFLKPRWSHRGNTLGGNSCLCRTAKNHCKREDIKLSGLSGMLGGNSTPIPCWWSHEHPCHQTQSKVWTIGRGCPVIQGYFQKACGKQN